MQTHNPKKVTNRAERRRGPHVSTVSLRFPEITLFDSAFFSRVICFFLLHRPSPKKMRTLTISSLLSSNTIARIPGCYHKISAHKINCCATDPKNRGHPATRAALQSAGQSCSIFCSVGGPYYSSLMGPVRFTSFFAVQDEPKKIQSSKKPTSELRFRVDGGRGWWKDEATRTSRR